MATLLKIDKTEDGTSLEFQVMGEDEMDLLVSTILKLMRRCRPFAIKLIEVLMVYVENELRGKGINPDEKADEHESEPEEKKPEEKPRKKTSDKHAN